LQLLASLVDQADNVASRLLSMSSTAGPSVAKMCCKSTAICIDTGELLDCQFEMLIACFCVVQYKKRQEADRLLQEDERRLRKEMNAKRAREEAEKLHQVIVCLFADKIVFFCLFVQNCLS